jgi:Cu-Zn family superoxide dismutase
VINAADTVINRTAKSIIIDNKGNEIGSAFYTQGTEGVLIEIDAKGLTPGKHGMHFHEVGTCEDHDHFKLTKGHIMPSGKPHGYLNPNGPHEGNLPNLIVGSDGTVHVELYSSLISLTGENGKPSLLDDDGSTLIIHQNPDDHKSQPIGSSGDRVACGLVVETVKNNK